MFLRLMLCTYAGGTGLSQEKVDAAVEVRELIQDVREFLQRVQR